MALLLYQKKWISDTAQVMACEKSRQIGITWSDAFRSALDASREDGVSTYYMSYNKDMTRKYISYVAMWAKKIQAVVSKVEENTVIIDGEDFTIFRIAFASGFEVVGLPGKASALRSKNGKVVLDEAAFMEDLKEVLKAAIAFTMWGGQVRIISTHNGESNPFNEMIQDIRAGKLPYSLHRTDLDDALDQGLYKTICKVKKQKWTKQKQEKWKDNLLKLAGENAAEEYYCIPSPTRGVWLTRNIIENCMQPGIPVIEWVTPATDFVDWPKDRAYRETKDWCKEHLAPVLDELPKLPHYMGVDFARSGDLSTFWPAFEDEGLSIHTPFVLELRNAPFRTQEQIISYILNRLPRLSGVALDARGNGQALAEYVRQDFGAHLVQEVMFSTSWYRENMPRLKAGLEDRTITLPKNSNILDDLRGLKMKDGIAKPPDKSTGKKGKTQRHCDSAVALALALFAHAELGKQEPFEVTFAPATPEKGLDFRGFAI